MSKVEDIVEFIYTCGKLDRLGGETGLLKSREAIIQEATQAISRLIQEAVRTEAKQWWADNRLAELQNPKEEK